MTFYRLLKNLQSIFQSKAYDAKGNEAHKRDEVENNTGMMEDDAEKREGYLAVWIKLTALTLEMSLQ